MITPMNRTKQNYNLFLKQVEKHYNVVSLSGTKGYSKMTAANYHGKGVHNDCLRIFRHKGNKDKSFSIAYNYKNIEVPQIIVSVKEGDDYLNRTFEIKEVNKKLREFSVTTDIIEDIKNHFELTASVMTKDFFENIVKDLVTSSIFNKISVEEMKFLKNREAYYLMKKKIKKKQEPTLKMLPVERAFNEGKKTLNNLRKSMKEEIEKKYFSPSFLKDKSLAPKVMYSKLEKSILDKRCGETFSAYDRLYRILRLFS